MAMHNFTFKEETTTIKTTFKKKNNNRKKKQERSAKEGNEKFSIIVSLEICTDN